MEDARIREFETSLWTGDADHYRDLIDPECVMVVPAKPFMLSGEQAIETVSHTPRWKSVELEDLQIVRPEDGMIAIAYHARASRDGQDQAYEAYCTTTLRRRGHDDWKVVQHSQMVPLARSEG